jgi:hypothetical protein
MANNKDATLEGIPVEMAANICTFLSTNDLLNLRLTSRYIASVTVNELSEQFDEKLRGIAVVITEEGLTTFEGRLAIPEFRRRVEDVHFLDHRLYTPETSNRVELFGQSYIDNLDVVSLLQYQAENSGKVSTQLVNILRTLKDVSDLERIFIGSSDRQYPDFYASRNIIGIPSLLRSLKAQQHDGVLCLQGGGGFNISLLQLATSVGLVFQALRTVNFSRRIVEAQFEESRT